MTEEERLELERLRLGGANNLSEALDVPMPVTNVGLMGEPLREQPSVEDIRTRTDPDGPFGRAGGYANYQENQAGFQGFMSGLGRVFTDTTGSDMRAERYAPRNQPIDIVPSGNTMQPDTPMLDSIMESGVGPFQPGAVDFSKPPTTNVPSGTAQPSGITMGADGVINLPALTRDSSLAPEATFLRADGSIGEIFPGQRIGDAFPGNPDTPSLGGQVQDVDLPGGTGFVRAPEGMVKTIGPDGRMIFATQEQANAMAPTVTAPTVTEPTATAPTTAGQQSRLDAMGLNMESLKQIGRDAMSGPRAAFRYLTDPSQPSFGEVVKDVAQEQGTGSGFETQGQSSAIPQGQPGSRMMTMEFRDANQDGIEDRSQGIFRPGDLGGGPLGPVMLPRGSGANLPTMASVNAMSGMAPQGLPALSAYEQASMDREAGIAARDRLPGETQTQRDTRIAQSRTQRSSQGGLSQADARDLAQGMAKGATEGEKMRALQIQSRLGLGSFRPGTPRVDKLSQATSMVDRMISGGQLSPEKRNAAIQKIMGVGSLDNTAGAAGAGVIGSAEFDRVASQLQEGGSLYNMGIRVDPSVVDPLTGAAQIYREKPGLEFGPPERLPVSPELLQQLLPYARSVRQGGTMTQDFTNMGMQVNQFAGSR